MYKRFFRPFGREQLRGGVTHHPQEAKEASARFVPLQHPDGPKQPQSSRESIRETNGM